MTQGHGQRAAGWEEGHVANARKAEELAGRVIRTLLEGTWERVQGEAEGERAARSSPIRSGGPRTLEDRRESAPATHGPASSTVRDQPC
jgi:hypothetical protein